MDSFDIKAFESAVEIQWCPGCSNFGILQAIKKAFVELRKAPHEICLVSGIGQAAKLPHYLRCNLFNGLHGRAIPVATGICATNPKLTTVVVTGDGDCYGEGGNHFLHALRRNPDMTLVVHNNEVYALTKGQASPTTQIGEKTTLQTRGVDIPPLNMPALAIGQGCTFVARGFAGEIEHLKELLVAAVRHRGFSYIDVVQPCITWGTRPMQWYLERVYKLDDDHDRRDREAALKLTTEWEKKIPIGILYEAEPREAFGDSFRARVTAEFLPTLRPIGPDKINEILVEFKG
ncbi:MAG: 2-oxoacid ferredoxin oxidoreductase [Desulfobacteraceae bacterium]|nr:MAG: 2-oxoacid ferredoxin oxidoreductase [Desulfobacteraceae bacterium]